MVARSDPEDLAAWLRAGGVPGLHGLVVERHGRRIFEWYGEGEDFRWNEPLGRVTFGPDVLHDVRSVTKSVVALLYGIALAGGCVPEPGEGLLDRFPEYADLAADPRRARLTVEHALTMTLGLEWNEGGPYTGPANSEIAMELAPDRYRFALDRPITGPPGERWTYNGGASTLVGGLIAKGTGEPLPSFARRVLFAPLGIAEAEWNAGDDGVASAASGLRLSPRALTRIGRLVLDDGRADGCQVVPATWLRAMLRPRVPIADGLRYGYQWYSGDLSELTGVRTRWSGGIGNGGQRLMVLPGLDAVVAVTAGGYNAEDRTTRTVLTEVVRPLLTGR